MAAGDPTGGDLVAGTFDGGTLTTSFAEKTISLSGTYSIVSGTKYAIVVRATSVGSGTPLEMVTKQPSTIAGGSEYLSTDSGVSWTESSFSGQTYDNWFKTQASSVDKDSATYAEEGTFNDIYGTHWLAQTFTAGSSYSIDAIILKLRKTPFGSPGTVTVSIRATVPVFAPPEGRPTQKRLIAFAKSSLYYEDI